MTSKAMEKRERPAFPLDRWNPANIRRNPGKGEFSSEA
jgi:hypothetical protein